MIAVTDGFLSPIATADVVFSVTRAGQTSGPPPRLHGLLIESFYELVEPKPIGGAGRDGRGTVNPWGDGGEGRQVGPWGSCLMETFKEKRRIT